MRGRERGRKPCRASRAVCGGDRGFVTAESAVVLPVLVVFATALVWGLLVMAAQIQCVDAARTGARAAARQDPADAIIEVTRATAPRGAEVTISREGDQLRVMVVAKPPALRGLPFEVREEAVAAAEAAGPAGQAVGPGETVGPAEGVVGGAQRVTGDVP
ncbi:TadE family type IV pilus minor pilin [Streptomyces sp. NPDC017435]|uniref:TadE family type IV pilus minor pilin n=1 Tax=Streptomyces sp. NPDC017435 TaxID=3364995 RepID=UPI0037B02894